MHLQSYQTFLTESVTKYPASVKGYSIKVHPVAARHQMVHVDLLRGNKKVGYVHCEMARSLSSKNPESYEEIEAAIDTWGLNNPKIYAITNARITDDESRGLGLGVDMYVAAVKELGKIGAIAIPDTYSSIGSTTGDAKRVWNNSRFKSQVATKGLVAVSKDFLEKGKDHVKDHEDDIRLKLVWAQTKPTEWGSDGMTKEKSRIINFREWAKRVGIPDDAVNKFLAAKEKKAGI